MTFFGGRSHVYLGSWPSLIDKNEKNSILPDMKGEVHDGSEGVVTYESKWSYPGKTPLPFTDQP